MFLIAIVRASVEATKNPKILEQNAQKFLSPNTDPIKLLNFSVLESSGTSQP
jgi:hypothetical protein